MVLKGFAKYNTVHRFSVIKPLEKVEATLSATAVYVRIIVTSGRFYSLRLMAYSIIF